MGMSKHCSECLEGKYPFRSVLFRYKIFKVDQLQGSGVGWWLLPTAQLFELQQLNEKELTSGAGQRFFKKG